MKSSGSEGPLRSAKIRRGSALLVLFSLILIGGYALTVWWVSGSGVALGTTVRGVNIGGTSPTEGAQHLEQALEASMRTPIPVAANGHTAEIDPVKAGLEIDWAATVQTATGLVTSPRELVRRMRGDVPTDPVVVIDKKKLAAALSDLSELATSDPVEPTITYDKKAKVVFTTGKAGTELDLPSAVEIISAEYLHLPYEKFSLPVISAEPKVSTEVAERLVEEFAKPAVAGPIKINVEIPPESATDPAPRIKEVTATPEAIAKALTFVPQGPSLKPDLNARKLHAALVDELAGIERDASNARIIIKDGKPKIVRSKSGRTVDVKGMAASVSAALPVSAPQARTATATLSVAQPKFTTADAKALNITKKLSSFRQWFPPAAYRAQNVGQAAEYLNGTILQDGETFSMNDTIKERTAANGYTKGFIIAGGRFREELGGGVSIITTATWTAGFFAGLERVEQHAHGLYISRYEAGLEATVAWGLLDLKLRNETGNAVMITATRYSNGVLIEMWGTKKFDKVTADFTARHSFSDFDKVVDDSEKCVPSEGVRGFSIAVTRRRHIDGKVVSRETWPTNYRATPNVVCTNPKASTG